MFCSKCGHNLANSSGNFCPECGTPKVSQQTNFEQGEQPGKGKAVASLILGITAMVLPIPVLDLIIGIAGIILAISSKNDGYVGGMRTAGFVCSIIGTIFAAIFTYTVLIGGYAFTTLTWSVMGAF